MSTPLAYFGINSSALTLGIDLAIIFAVVLYLSLIFWTVQDARRRIAQPALIAAAFLISLVPFLGPIIYSVLRPPEFLEDVKQRQMEMRAAEARLHDPAHELCPHCDYPTERDFLRCPSCLRRLKEPCTNCSRALDPAWTICPWCETEVVGAIAPRRTSRRESSRESSRRSGSLVSEETQAFTPDPFGLEEFSTGIDRSDQGSRSGLPLAPDPAARERTRRRPRAGD